MAQATLKIDQISDEIKALLIICKNANLENVHSQIMQLYTKVLQEYCDNNLNSDSLIKIEGIIDYLHDEIHTGHWSEVPIIIRQSYTFSTILKILIMIKTKPDFIDNIIYIIDMCFLLGAPINESNNLLTNLASKLSKMIPLNNDLIELINKRKTTPVLWDDHSYICLGGVEIDSRQNDDFSNFYDEYFLKYKPVKITNGMSTWPAMHHWKNIEYLLKIAAYRTVPIEIGSKYSDENWSQKLMLFQDFIKDYFMSEKGEIGYLAQHNLFEQVPELFKDVSFPKYVQFSRDLEADFDEPDCNVWFGPKGTVSPLHFDPRDNILAQVFGAKQVILFSPDDSKYLCPHETLLLGNTSQIDPVNPDLEKFPNFTKAKMYKCLLKEGEMLYIPKKWWHHVTSLQPSFSVNFWWE